MKDKKNEVGTLVPDELDEKIKALTNKKVVELLEVDVSEVDRDEFEAKMDQAKLGMIFLRDREIMRRAQGGQTIRIMTLVYDDPVQRAAYIRATMPEVKLIEG